MYLVWESCIGQQMFFFVRVKFVCFKIKGNALGLDFATLYMFCTKSNCFISLFLCNRDKAVTWSVAKQENHQKKMNFLFLFSLFNEQPDTCVVLTYEHQVTEKRVLWVNDTHTCVFPKHKVISTLWMVYQWIKRLKPVSAWQCPCARGKVHKDFGFAKVGVDEPKLPKPWSQPHWTLLG